MESEFQEIRLAKAELLIIDGKEKEALALVKKNIVGAKNFHLPSYLFMADFFQKKKYYFSMFQAYKIALDHVSGIKLSDIVLSRDFEKKLDQIPAVPEQTLELAFTMAQRYFTLGQETKEDEHRKIRFLEFARRYFLICKKFHYSPGHPEYFLGIIDIELKEYSSAVNQFLDARELLEEQQINDAALKSGLDFYLGSSLINQGSYDAGVLYLKTIYHSEKINESLKNYADMYFKALSNEQYSISFSAGLKYHDNIHQLNNAYLGRMNLFETEYGKASGIYQNLGASGYYYSGMGKKWSSTIILYTTNQKPIDRTQRIRDYSTAGTMFLLQLNESKKTIPGINFSYNRSFYRPLKNSPTKSYETTIEVNPQINYLTKKGISTAKLIIDRTRDSYGEQLYKYGLSFTHVSLFRRVWLAPSLTIGGHINEESRPYNSSANYNASITNHATLAEYGDLFLTFSIAKYLNDDPTLDYLEKSLDLTWSKPIKAISGLLFSLAGGKYIRDDEVPARTEDSTVEIKLSLSF